MDVAVHTMHPPIIIKGTLIPLQEEVVVAEVYVPMDIPVVMDTTLMPHWWM